MKKVYLLITAILIEVGAFAQCSLTVTGSTNVSCNGSCDGSVSISTVGVPNYNYLWSPGGQTVQNPSDLCAGTNTVTMTDANNCVATTSVVITEPAILQDSTSQTNIASCDSCNGSATVYPSGGTPGIGGYTHKWSTNPIQTTATATGLCPGTYTDTITDANNCQAIATVTITQAAALSVSVNVTDVSSSTACDGGATASPSGGNAPYTFQWSPGGQTTAIIIAQCAGAYTLCVTDTDGCSVCDSNVTIGVATGIKNQLYSDMVHVFPNPSKEGIFTISFDKPILSIKEVSVLNILGEEVYHMSTSNQNMKLDLMDQRSGTYFIRIITNNNIITQKIMIE